MLPAKAGMESSDQSVVASWDGFCLLRPFAVQNCPFTWYLVPLGQPQARMYLLIPSMTTGELLRPVYKGQWKG